MINFINQKKIKILLLLIILIPIKVQAINLNISSKNAILYNLDSKEILYEKNAKDKVQIASLTKIMTAIIALENIDDINRQTVIIKDDFKGIAEANLVTAGFKIGEIVTYKDLLYGLLLPSGADAAKAIARNVAGSEEEFVKLMNQKAKKLNLKNTNFSNVIGLDDENNYSTAEDLLIIFSKALEIEEFKNIIKTKEYKTTTGKLTLKSTIQKNAKAFNIDVPYIIGGKTGTTTGAGLCLATIAKDKNTNYILITLGATYDKKAPHHIEDAETIYDYFIQNYSNQKIVDKNKPFKKLNVKYSKKTKIELYPEKDIIKYLPNDYDKNNIRYIYDGVEEVTPFTKEKLGTLKIYYKEDLLDNQTIYLKEKIPFSIINFIKEHIIIASLVTISIIILIIKRARK